MESYNLDLISVSSEDINQEVALLQLKGVAHPNRALIFRRLARAEATFDEIPVGSSLLWSTDPIPEPEVTQQLIDWAFQQSEAVAEMIFDFLDEPTDERVAELVDSLTALGVPLASPASQRQKHKELSLTDLVLQALQRGPQPLDALYQLAHSLQPSKRPEAAIRQIIRRLTRKQLVITTPEGIQLNDEV